jgi:arginine/lysine/ornithine decarboxylase
MTGSAGTSKKRRGRGEKDRTACSWQEWFDFPQALPIAAEQNTTPSIRPSQPGGSGYDPGMDQSDAPLLAGLADYHRRGRYGFTPPGHRQGRGVDARTRSVIGDETFRADVLATAGLDDRKSSEGLLAGAERLMAEAVGADYAFFSTCGSSLSVKAAMLAVAGGGHDLLVGRDAHKSVTAGLIFAGVQPRWVRPRWDADVHLAHPPSPRQVAQSWDEHPRCRRSPYREPHSLRHLRRHRGDCRCLS